MYYHDCIIVHRVIKCCTQFTFTAAVILQTFIDIQETANPKQVITSPPKVIYLGRAHRSRTTTEQSLIGYNGTLRIYLQNSPFPFDHHHPDLIHPSLDRPLSPSQTASGSIQPFATIHFADGPTDRWFRQMFRTMSALARYADKERRAAIVQLLGALPQTLSGSSVPFTPTGAQPHADLYFPPPP